jgi:hypothetical protein
LFFLPFFAIIFGVRRIASGNTGRSDRRPLVKAVSLQSPLGLHGHQLLEINLNKIFAWKKEKFMLGFKIFFSGYDLIKS